MRLPRRGWRRRRAGLPTVEPIIPTRLSQPFDDPAFLFEPKYDGFRGVLYLENGKCEIRSKRGHVFKRFDELCFLLPEFLDAKSAILDGEILSINSEGQPIFRDLLKSGAGSLAYAVFDLLWLNGKDLRGLA